MLGDYLTTILFFLCLIGMVCILLRNVIPGILSGFLAVLKMLLYLAALPFIAVFGMLGFIFRRRERIVGFITKTETFTRNIIHDDGAVSKHSYSNQVRVPVKSNKKFNKSGRF